MLLLAEDVLEAPESRPSRTLWTNRASGKIRASSGAAAIVKVLISTSAGFPERARTGSSRS